MNKYNDQFQSDHNNHLTTSIDGIFFHRFKTHGNFLVMLTFLCGHNEDIKRPLLDKCIGNFKLTSPDILKDIIHVYASRTSKIIIQDLKYSYFSILVHEMCDESTKE